MKPRSKFSLIVAALGAFLASTLWAGVARAADGAVISGKVHFKGGKAAAPKRTVLKMGAEPYCVQHYKEKGKRGAGTEAVIVNKDGTLRNVIVYVKAGLGDRTFDVPAEAVVLDQRGCVYKPHVIALMRGQKLTVNNSDNTLHNIHGLCKKNAEFNFGQPKEGMTRDLTFKRPETIKVKCDVHPWMGAYIMVLDHPFHSITGKDGSFSIEGLPPGRYVVAAWHEQYGEIQQKVAVSEDETTEITFEFAPD